TAALYRDTRKNTPISVQNLHTRGMALFALAAVCWATDFFLCEYVDGRSQTSVLPFNPQLHAFWHCFASVGFYMIIQYNLYAIHIQQGFLPRLKHWMYFVPVVHVDMPKVE